MLIYMVFSLNGFKFEYAITTEHLHLAELGLKGVEQGGSVEVCVRGVLTDDAVVVHSDCVHGVLLWLVMD